jgi:hypothetical protein
MLFFSMARPTILALTDSLVAYETQVARPLRTSLSSGEDLLMSSHLTVDSLLRRLRDYELRVIALVFDVPDSPLDKDFEQILVENIYRGLPHLVVDILRRFHNVELFSSYLWSQQDN